MSLKSCKRHMCAAGWVLSSPHCKCTNCQNCGSGLGTSLGFKLASQQYMSARKLGPGMQAGVPCGPHCKCTNCQNSGSGLGGSPGFKLACQPPKYVGLQALVLLQAGVPCGPHQLPELRVQLLGASLGFKLTCQHPKYVSLQALVLLLQAGVPCGPHCKCTNCQNCGSGPGGPLGPSGMMPGMPLPGRRATSIKSAPQVSQVSCHAYDVDSSPG